MARMTPVFLAEASRTAGGGVAGIAIVNYLLLELDVASELTGIVAATFNLGFVVFTLLLGNIFERFGRRKVLVVLSAINAGAALVYLLPLASPLAFATFMVARFLDGGATGMFWTTVQSYAKHYAEVDGEGHLRNAYTAWYNLSWNGGIIGGTILGWILTWASNTNLVGFYMCAAIAIIQLVAMTFARDEIKDTAREKTVMLDAGRTLTGQESATIASLPYPLVYVAVLVHSFTTGGFSMYIPAYIKGTSLPWHAPYLFFLVQAIAQTTSMTASGHLGERRLPGIVVIAPGLLGLTWILLGIPDPGVMIPVVVAMATLQGMLYSAGMRFLTNVAKRQNKGRIYSFWQFTMGFGRMAGPFSFGFFLAISLPFSIAFVATFGLATCVLLVIVHGTRSRSRAREPS